MVGRKGYRFKCHDKVGTLEVSAEPHDPGLPDRIAALPEAKRVLNAIDFTTMNIWFVPERGLRLGSHEIALTMVLLVSCTRSPDPKPPAGPPARDAGIIYCDAPADRLLDVGAHLASVLAVTMGRLNAPPPHGVLVMQSVVRQAVEVQAPVRRPLHSVTLGAEGRCVLCESLDGGFSCEPRACGERPAGTAIVPMQLRLDCPQHRLAMTFSAVHSPTLDGGVSTLAPGLDVWLVAEGEHPIVVVEGCFKGWRRAALVTDWRWPDDVVESQCMPLYVDTGGGRMSRWSPVDAGPE